MKYSGLESLKDQQAVKYTHRYKYLLIQVFSSDSVLQLIPHAAIPLPHEYSARGQIPERLPSLIPGLGMLSLNKPPAYLDESQPELRDLSRVLAERAQFMYDKLVEERNIICDTHKSPAHSPGEWKDTGSYYGRAPLRHRPYYENRDTETKASVDIAESGACKKYYSTYKKKPTLTGGLMAIWCQHLICLGFHKILKAEGRNDVFSGL